MKRLILSITACLALGLTQAQEVSYTLDLSNNNLTYNENMVWDKIYNNENLIVDGFVFSHTAPYGVGYYEGFIASYNSDHSNWLDAAGWSANQWGCMAQGGVSPYADKTTANNGTLGKPFLINYYSSYSLTSSDYGTSYITLENNRQPFIPQGIFVCNHPWGYYGCVSGDGFATPLVEKGGYYKVTFNGVNTAQGTTGSIDFYLAERQYSDRNGDGVIDTNDNHTNNQWQWCDLTALGMVDLIYITMDSSDKGEYGMNTASVVCMDGLQVTIPESLHSTSTPVTQLYATGGNLFVTLTQDNSLTIYNTTGTTVAQHTLSTGSHMLNVNHLPHGIYIVQCNNSTHKIVI